MTTHSPIAPEKIQIWLKENLGTLLNVPPSQIAINVPFDRYGLESADVVGITADLEDWLSFQLDDPVLMYEYNTIESFANYVATVVNQNA